MRGEKLEVRSEKKMKPEKSGFVVAEAGLEHATSRL